MGVVVIQDHLVPKHPAMGDHLEGQRLLGQRHVDEAILVVLALRVGDVLRGDAAAAAGHHPGSRIQEVVHLVVVGVLRPDLRDRVSGAVHVLGVPVARDDHVDLVLRRELHPVLLSPVGREVRHHDAPLGGGLGHNLVKPVLLLDPEVVEPLLASARTLGGTARLRAVGRRWVVGAADVVRRPVPVVERVPDVRVHEVVVDREVVVLHRDVVVQSRSHPPVLAGLRLGPRVADGLVPGHVHAPAAPVVVAEDPQPHEAIEAGTIVDVLEDLLELVCGFLLVLLGSSIGIHLGEVLGAAKVVHAAPVEVVTHVQDVRWLGLRGHLQHLVPDLELALLVRRPDELERLGLVPAVVEVGDRRQLPVLLQAAPVTDDEHVVGGLVVDADVV
mmetsp:Transcript_182304/g.443730  ORF Transcript_182304/g.443730 Transcript_182304/m.443730 type:complete len:387 (+) Transcript_182304:392-1552(+)